MSKRGRTRARELALQALYAIDVGRGAVGDAIAGDLWDEAPVAEEERRFAEEIVLGVVEHKKALDAQIDRWSHHWRSDRMAAVDRNVLRIGLWELGPGARAADAEEATPAPVVINEAIEMVRRFSTQESAALINGVLDRAAKELRK